MNKPLSRFVEIDKLLKQGKALVIYGPRGVGKTTLLTKFLESTRWKYRLDSGENIRMQQILGSQDFSFERAGLAVQFPLGAERCRSVV